MGCFPPPLPQAVLIAAGKSPVSDIIPSFFNRLPRSKITPINHQRRPTSRGLLTTLKLLHTLCGTFRYPGGGFLHRRKVGKLVSVRALARPHLSKGD